MATFPTDLDAAVRADPELARLLHAASHAALAHGKALALAEECEAAYRAAHYAVHAHLDKVTAGAAADAADAKRAAEIAFAWKDT